MNNIVINGRFLTRRLTGVDRYARELVKALDEIASPGEMVLALPGKSEVLDPLMLKNIEIIRVGHRRGYAWEQIDLARYIHKCKGIGLNLCNTAPLVNPGVVCIHDMNIRRNPNFFSKKFIFVYRTMFHRVISRARLILTDSKFSQSEMEHFYPKAKGRTLVTYCAWQHIKEVEGDCSVLSKFNLKSKSYYFAMSSLAPNKNLKWIVATANNNPQSTFVVAGGINKKVFGEHAIPHADNVKYLGYISDSEAKSLMENCKAFLYPTFYEGFGIPPLEALAAGSEIVVSDSEVMHEIYGSAAHYINPTVPVTNLDQLVGIRAGDARPVLRFFDWNKTATQLYEALGTLI